MATRMCLRPDFCEGVTARLIEKTNTPAWSPASVEDVDADAVSACFAPLAPLPGKDRYSIGLGIDIQDRLDHPE
jgi:hypothetical protein